MYTGGFVNGTDGLSTGETSLDLSFVQHERSYFLHLAIGGVMFDKVQVLLQYGADTNVAREVSCVLIWAVGCWMYMGLKGHVHIMLYCLCKREGNKLRTDDTVMYNAYLLCI